jgi:RHS repeat-associated protein
VRILGIILPFVLVISGLSAQPAFASEINPNVPPVIPEVSLPKNEQVQSVTIKTNQTSELSDITKVTATTDVDVSKTKDSISIIDSSTKKTVQTCETGTSCIYTYNNVDYAPNQSFYAKSTNLTSSMVEVANPAPEIYLYSTKETVNTQEAYQLKTSSEGTLPEGYKVFIVNEETQEIIADCNNLNSCSSYYQSLSSDSDTSQFTAYIASADSGISTKSELVDVLGQSNTVDVSRNPWNITLKAESPYVQEGALFGLSAKVNQWLPEGKSVYIYDITTEKLVSKDCSVGVGDAKCTAQIKYDESHQYRAYVADVQNETNLVDLQNIEAASNTVTVKRIPFVLTITSDATFDGKATYSGHLNQPTTFYVSAVLDTKTSKILEVCKGIAGCEANGPANSYGYPNATSGIEDGVKYVVGKWSGEDTAGTFNTKTEPGGYIYDIQASVDYVRPPTPVSHTTGSKVPHLTDGPIPNTGGGNPSEPCSNSCVADPVNTVTGEFYLSETDATVQSLVPLSFTREYAISKSTVKGSLGYGWSNAFDMKIVSSDGLPLDQTQAIEVVQENGSTTKFQQKDSGIWEANLKTRATLEQKDGKFVFTRSKDSIFTFNTAGQLEAIKNLAGHTMSFSYTSGKLTAVSNNRGQQLSISWGTNGLVKSVTTADGKTVQYTYTSDDLTKVTYPDNTYKTYAYSNHLITSFKDAKGGTTKNQYDENNRVSQQTDALNGITTMSYYDDYTSVTHPNGRTDNHYFNQNLQVYRIEQDANGAQPYNEYYEYDAAQNLLAITYPDGGTVEKTYDANGNPLLVKDRAGNITQNAYSDTNRLLSTTNADGKTASYVYDSKGNLTSSTDYNGNTTNYTLNSDGTTQYTVAPDGGKTDFIYNAQGLISQITDPAGSVTKHEFNADGYLKSATDALNQTTSYTYNSVGLVSAITYPNGYSETVEYDANGNIAKTTDRLGRVKTYTYDALNRELSETDPLNHVVKTTYDNMGHVIKTTDALLKTTTYEYNGLGQLTQSTDARSKVTSYSYDEVGNLITVTDAKNRDTFYNYDANGNRIESIYANGTKSSTKYNALQQVVKATDTQSRNTAYAYDANGNLLTTTLPNLTVESTVYDNMNRPIQLTDTDNKVKSWTYNKLGQQTQFTNTDNSVTSYTYDAAGNPKTLTRPDASQVNYEYKYNQLVKETYADSVKEYIRNQAGMVTQEKQGTDVINYSYDNAGNLTNRGPPSGAGVSYTYTVRDEVASITYPSGQVINYTYDNVGNLLTAKNTAIGSFTYTYDETNNVTTVTNPNKTKQSNQYNNTDEITQTVIKNGTTSLYNKDYSYNENTGYLEKSDTTIKGNAETLTENYSYDSLSRLSSVTSDQTAAGKYQYSNTGNLTNNLGQSQTFNQANQLTATPSTTNTYDARGNRSTSNGTTYSYNQKNQLTQFKTNSKQVDYTYDVDGLIKNRTDSTGTDEFVWDYQNSIPLLLSDGDYEYFYGDSTTPIAQIQKTTGVVTYLHADALGSVVSATNTAGTQVASYVYKAYGELQDVGTTDKTHSKTRFGYAGEWLDPDSGLYNLRARWYEPMTGTFLTRDPLEQATNEAYSYGSGNPLANTDPSGMASYWEGGQSRLQWIDSWGSPIREFFNKPEVKTAVTVTLAVVAVVGIVACTVATAGVCGGAAAPVVIALIGAGTSVLDTTLTSDCPPTGGQLFTSAAIGAVGGGKGTVAKAVGKTGWTVGKSIGTVTRAGNNPTWKVGRARYWKNEANAAKLNPNTLTPEQQKRIAAPKITEPTRPWKSDDIARMEKGRAPQRMHPKGFKESMELSHESVPQRNGGFEDVVQRWPQEHAAVDQYRRLGSQYQ